VLAKSWNIINALCNAMETSCKWLGDGDKLQMQDNGSGKFNGNAINKQKVKP